MDSPGAAGRSPGVRPRPPSVGPADPGLPSRLAAFAIAAALLAAAPAALARHGDFPGRPPEPAPDPPRARVSAGPSLPLGLPWAGRLRGGRLLPAAGAGYVTWDPILKRSPGRPWRRHGTGRLLDTLRRVLARRARAHQGAPPVLVGDLSRPRGGDFGPRFGGIGHASHQNGLDADVYYPRTDGRLRPARVPRQVDRAAAQALVDAFVRAGAIRVFVGPSLRLRGPARIVQPLVHHDDHLHVRLPPRA